MTDANNDIESSGQRKGQHLDANFYIFHFPQLLLCRGGRRGSKVAAEKYSDVNGSDGFDGWNRQEQKILLTVVHYIKHLFYGPDIFIIFFNFRP